MLGDLVTFKGLKLDSKKNWANKNLEQSKSLSICFGEIYLSQWLSVVSKEKLLYFTGIFVTFHKKTECNSFPINSKYLQPPWDLPICVWCRPPASSSCPGWCAGRWETAGEADGRWLFCPSRWRQKYRLQEGSWCNEQQHLYLQPSDIQIIVIVAA